MAIPKRATPRSAEKFIKGAPDAPADPAPRWQRGAKTQITFSLDPELLERIDAAARRRHVSRAALLSMWAVEKLEGEPA